VEEEDEEEEEEDDYDDDDEDEELTTHSSQVTAANSVAKLDEIETTSKSGAVFANFLSDSRAATRGGRG
jgi:hypothetical protein